MIRRILLDVDDVCNRFTMSALKYAGCPVDEFSNHDYPVECGYDILGAANKLLGEERYTLKPFWNMFGRDFWAGVPVSAEFDWLLDACVDLVGRDNVCLLTAPTKDPDCLAGKLDWIHNHCPEWLHRQYLVGPRKQFCAHPEALMIDDSNTNVAQFRAWGGQAILVPRPWNTNHSFETLPYLQTRFEQFRVRRFYFPTFNQKVCT